MIFERLPVYKYSLLSAGGRKAVQFKVIRFSSSGNAAAFLSVLHSIF
jgi:hypothetical protein